jgi:hypothetical protein
MTQQSSEQYEYRRPKHEYSVDDDGGQTDEQLRREFEEWVAQCESDKSFADK